MAGVSDDKLTRARTHHSIGHKSNRIGNLQQPTIFSVALRFNRFDSAKYRSTAHQISSVMFNLTEIFEALCRCWSRSMINSARMHRSSEGCLASAVR